MYHDVCLLTVCQGGIGDWGVIAVARPYIGQAIQSLTMASVQGKIE